MACAMRSIPPRAEQDAAGAVLRIAGLSVAFVTPQGEIVAVQEASLSVGRGECLGVVGESGAGKSQLLLATLGLLPATARVTGSANLGSEPLIGRPQRELDRIRGARVGLVFQDPMTSLTPHLRVGEQIAEPIVTHCGAGWGQARRKALALLDRVHVPDAARRMRQYPHELSGGMRQRVMIAIALACAPELLIADEPTTALDVTIQAQILALLVELKRDCGMAMVLITHDFGAVAGVADRVAVMQSGRIVELDTAAAVLKTPRHPYTQALLQQVLTLDSAAPRAGEAATTIAATQPALDISSLAVQYPAARSSSLREARTLHALHDVSLELRPGEALGVVGESGSGKSTLVRAALQLIRPGAGRVTWLGRDLAALPAGELKRLRRGLGPETVSRYPHELSGGQCQRVGIARAMIVGPRLLVCDEPVSALDVSVQAQILDLLASLKSEHRMSILLVSHNLAVVRRLWDRVLGLVRGRMMELADSRTLFSRPLHPYTRELLDAVPVVDPDVQPRRLALARLTEVAEMQGEDGASSGCSFRARCRHAIAECAARVPAWEAAPGGGRVACHRFRELADGILA